MAHPTTIDKYQIIRPLDKGAFGQVYLAQDRALDTQKAIKVLDLPDPTQFINHLQEAQILNLCRHKHIVTINGANVFDVNGAMKVVLDLEYMPDGSIESAMATRWISTREAVVRMRGALHGLEYAHDQGFLHRDIKPGNILLDGSSAKLSDFGLATALKPNASCSGRGYTTHLAPEYFTGRTTSAQTDIFAAGMTLFRIISNIANWRAVTAAMPDRQKLLQEGKLLVKIGHERFVPRKLQRIINKACHKNPAKRYKTAQAFCQQLDGLRFAIDWIRVIDYNWQGRLGNDKYSCVINPATCAVTVKKNRRRITSLCTKHADLAEAIAAQETYIAESTVE